MRRGAALAPIAASLLAATPARAIDPFEIQVYDGTADPPGVPGLELHTNHVFSGLTTAEPPELPQHHQTHFTLEPSLGLFPFWEIGGYFQTAFRPDGTFDYAGVKLRSKFVTPPSFSDHLRLGCNVELSLLPEKYDRARWGTEVRPIVAFENDYVLLAANPIVDFAWTGDELRAGPTFEPTVMAKGKILGKVALGLEYYASIGPIAHPASLADEPHYLYEAVDLLAVRRVEVNFGVGEGLTAASNGLVMKLIVGYIFGPG